MRQLKITKSITNRESQSLEKYLQEIGKVELISPEEEVKLAVRIKQGDQKALDKLEGLVVQRLFELAKMGLSGTGLCSVLLETHTYSVQATRCTLISTSC